MTRCPRPLQVRCAAVFALGTFVGNSAERTDHSTTIDHNVAMMLAQLINDGSPVVRKVCVPQHRAGPASQRVSHAPGSARGPDCSNEHAVPTGQRPSESGPFSVCLILQNAFLPQILVCLLHLRAFSGLCLLAAYKIGSFLPGSNTYTPHGDKRT